MGRGNRISTSPSRDPVRKVSHRMWPAACWVLTMSPPPKHWVTATVPPAEMPPSTHMMRPSRGETRLTAAMEDSPAEEISAVISMLMNMMDRESRIRGRVIR